MCVCVFFLDILLYLLTPLLVMMRRRCDRSGARECCVSVERVALGVGWGLGEEKHIERGEGNDVWVRNHLIS